MYLVVAALLVVALNLPLVVAARSLAGSVTRWADRRPDELGPDRRARLQRYVRA